MKTSRFYLLIALSFPLLSFSQNYSNIDFAHRISEKDLKKNIQVLTSNKMQGRETGTKGQKLAANYIYSQFKMIGLKGLDYKTDSLSYFQSFHLSKLQLPSGRMQINGKVFLNYKDFVADPIQDSISNNLEVIFIGGSPIENYSKIDFKDKAICFLSTNFNKAFSQSYKIWKHSKPKLILFNDPINTKAFNRYMHITKRIRSNKLRLMETIKDSIDLKEQSSLYTYLKQTQVIPISTRVAKEISGLKSKQLVQLATSNSIQKTVTSQLKLKLKKDDETIKTENVLALIEGAAKPDEYILISAHYDHLGTKNGLVYTGANDNASGTAALLEIAEAFKQAELKGYSPKRSLIFIAFTGEEKGLLGSKYFVNNSPVPLQSIKTNLNMDMLGRIDDKHQDPDYIYLLGTSDLAPKFKSISDSLNILHPKLILDYEYDQPHNPLYGASDQASFVEKGIPSIMYFNGLHEDYHTTNDTADKLHYKNIKRVAQLVFLTAWELANQD